MKTLYLVRHAKSSWDQPGLDDHDRPLAKRGRKAAARIGEYMRAEKMTPDVVCCSTALRCRQTLDTLLPYLKAKRQTINYSRDLYAAPAGALLESVRGLNPEAGSAMIVAHNPGISDLLYWLTGAGGPDGMRTGALAEVEIPGQNWSELDPRGARLVRLVTPKELA